MHDQFEAYLSAGGATFGSRDADLLRAIAAHGSVSGAASDLGRSRSRALDRLADLEAAFGSLVTRRRGGAGGGGSHLTPDGEALLDRYVRLLAALSGTAGAAETVSGGRVTGLDGELAVVETDAGSIRALAVGRDGTLSTERVGVGTEVQVSLRADAVTLHAPDDLPPADATSARNRLSGTVVDVDRGESVARVGVDVGLGGPLLALVTTASVDRLALAEDRPVVASFKATATRVTARPTPEE